VKRYVKEVDTWTFNLKIDGEDFLTNGLEILNLFPSFKNKIKSIGSTLVRVKYTGE